MTEIEQIQTDILILGSGGAGLFAALHAHKADPDLSYASERSVIESFSNTLALEPRQDLNSIKGPSRALSG